MMLLLPNLSHYRDIQSLFPDQQQLTTHSQCLLNVTETTQMYLVADLLMESSPKRVVRQDPPLGPQGSLEARVSGT